MPSKNDASQPDAEPKEKKRRVTRSKKAGLIMPVTRIRNKLKRGRYANIIGTGGAVYMAAVLEYVAAEVLECAGNVTRESQRQRITPRHVTMAVRSDSELDVLFKDVTIAEGGVLPFVHEVLLRKCPRSAPKRQAESDDSSD